MNRKYEHIIWDWNGTLFDDAWLCVDIMNGMLASRGMPRLSRERYAQIFEFPVRGYYGRLGFDPVRDPFETLSDEFIAAYVRRKYECALRDGAESMLTDIHRAGVSQNVLSAAKHEHLLIILNHFGIMPYFRDVSGLDNHHADGKLANAHTMMDKLALEPGKTLLIGDTLHVVYVARAIGVDCVLVCSGHQSRERLRATGQLLIADLHELGKRL